MLKIKISNETKANVLLKLFGLFKIPMLSFISAKVIRIDDQMFEVKVPLTRKTKNHLGSMYFAALAAGADTAAGLSAMLAMLEEKKWIHLSFKDFHADFFKRAEGDVIFRCESVAAVKQLVKRAIETKDRLEMKIPVNAYTKDYEEPVASFSLTISLKKKS